MRTLVAIAAVFMLTACQSAYYGTMEKFGIEKRDILVDRVDDTKDAQEEAQQTFRSALEQLSQLIQFDGGELEDQYDALRDEYEASQDAAERVRDRIAAVDDVAQALFDEWQNELDEYQSQSLRRDSEQKLRHTQRRYADLIRTMRRSADKMDPVLERMQDNVLYLKHNLNAAAIDAIKGEYQTLQGDIKGLIEDMEQAIAESDRFIDEMRTQ